MKNKRISIYRLRSGDRMLYGDVDYCRIVDSVERNGDAFHVKFTDGKEINVTAMPLSRRKRRFHMHVVICV